MPPINDVVSVKINSTGIYYNGTKSKERLLILATNHKHHSRGLSFKITNMENLIDIASESMKENLKIVSLTH